MSAKRGLGDPRLVNKPINDSIYTFDCLKRIFDISIDFFLHIAHKPFIFPLDINIMSSSVSTISITSMYYMVLYTSTLIIYV